MPMPITPSRPIASASTSSSSLSASAADPKAALLAAFPPTLLSSTSPLLPQLASFLRIYGSQVTAADLYYKVEAMLLSEKRPDGQQAVLSEELVEQLKKDLQREWEAKTKQQQQPREGMATPVNGLKQRSGLGSLLGIGPRTPATPAPRSAFSRSSLHPSTSSSSSSTPTPNRAGEASSHGLQSPSSPVGEGGTAMTVMESLNPHLTSTYRSSPLQNIKIESDMEDVKPLKPTSRVALAVGTDPKAWSYRYMFERPGMKGHALDDAIEVLTQVLLETYQFSLDDVADPSVVSQETVYVIGRVCPALTKADGQSQNASKQEVREAKLKDGIIIEASKTIGSGSRTPLRFAQSVTLRGIQDGGKKVIHAAGSGNRLGLVPGMICAFRGRNGGGDGFVAEEVLLPPPLPQAATRASELIEYQHSPARLDGDNLKVTVTSGPYTNDDDLNFTPWHRFMDDVERQRPDVILLLGPFLSASHASLSSPSLQQMPAEIFQDHISRRLNALCEASTRTTAILLPSTKDVVHSHIAWPQPMLEKNALGLHKRVKCLPNPCLFSINEVVFGATTADVLRDVRAEEVVVGVSQDPSVTAKPATNETSDAIARSVRTLLGQRSFYPVFPASAASQLPLDVTHSSLAQFKTVTPDILLVPSVLTPFARVVDGTVCVNPGPLARGVGLGSGDAAAAPTTTSRAKGSFARFDIVPMKKDRLRDLEENGDDAEVPIGHEIYERARVDLVRI